MNQYDDILKKAIDNVGNSRLTPEKQAKVLRLLREIQEDLAGPDADELVEAIQKHKQEVNKLIADAQTAKAEKGVLDALEAEKAVLDDLTREVEKVPKAS